MKFINNRLPISRIKILGAKILYTIVTVFVGKKKRIIVRSGIKYEIDLSEGMELSLYLFRKFQSHVTQNALIQFNKDDVIFDVGANVGLMTMQFAQLAPQGHIYSFEPTFYALDRLKINLSLNPDISRNVTVVNAFVSEKSSKNPDLVAYSSWKVNGERNQSDHPIHCGTPKEASGVEAISIDDFVIERKIGKLNFIKIDTDGHEFQVLNGARAAIAKFKPKIIFEIGLFLMEEKDIAFKFYSDFFDKLKYELFDAKTGKKVDNSNYTKYVPRNGSTDLIAIPLLS